MNFAFLEATDVAGGFSNATFWIIMIVMFGLMYLLMWRPQKKKEKQANELRNSVEIGDEVTTIGGIVGRVVSIKEDTFVLETAGDRSRMRFRRWAIQEVGKLQLDEPDTNVKADTAAPEKKKKGGFFGKKDAE